jgi:hypothetical protein
MSPTTITPRSLKLQLRSLQQSPLSQARIYQGSEGLGSRFPDGCVSSDTLIPRLQHPIGN